MKLIDLITEGLTKYPNPRIEDHMMGKIYLNGEDVSLIIGINRSDGKINTLGDDEPDQYKVHGVILANYQPVGEITLGVTNDYTPIRLTNIEIKDGNVEKPSDEWTDDEEENEWMNGPPTVYDKSKDFRKQSFATQAVSLVASLAPNNELIINDIQKEAKGFWDKLGVEYFHDHGRTDMISAKIRI